MLTHIHHINFVVKDLTLSAPYFTQLLSHEPIIEDLSARQVKTARYNIGESLLVLVQPTTNTGVVADILQKKGEGVFLLSFATESLDEALDRLALNIKEKRKGLENWTICDLTPFEQFGVILQLTETTKNIRK